MAAPTNGGDPRSVSIVIPTWNGEATLDECLRHVFEQDAPFERDVLVIDSSSTDRTREIAGRYPARLVVIDQRDFDHGDTRNLGAFLTRGELIVFLVQDAYPARPDWLRTLVANFRDPRVAGAYCRVLPRPEASLRARRAAEGDLCFREARIEARIDDAKAYARLSPEERRLFVSFNDVASCLRRSVWERLPFARTPFGEDLVWARGALEGGHTVVYDPEAPVVHSHEYGPRQVRARTRTDGWWNASYLGRICVPSPRDALALARRATSAEMRERRAAGERGGPIVRAGAFVHHLSTYWGFFEGGRNTTPRITPLSSPDRPLKVLFVAHAFPPEITAGTEVLTAALARALQERGHETVVFHRSADHALPDFSLHEGRWDGLRTVRLVNHGRTRSLDENIVNARVEERFREVLLRERPDVVHVQHLLHLSATIPRLCADAGVASVVTLNDYWFRCAKVQLVRADGTACAGPPPLLGCAACITRRPHLIEPLRAVSRPMEGPLLRLVRRQPQPPAWWPSGWVDHWNDGSHVLRRAPFMVDELLQAGLIIAPSRYLRDRMVEAGVPAERLVVSDYGMETRWLSSYRRRKRDGFVRFGFVGSLVPHKGLELLAEAFDLLGRPEAQLHVHGDAESLPVFRETAEKARARVVKGGLVFRGGFAPAQLGAVLSQIDVLVVPSTWYENSPLTIHEAFQARLPVIVADLGGMRELVENGRGGLRFQAGDAKALAHVMRLFLDEPGLIERVGDRAPGVKTAEEWAAEMEVRYRQQLGLLAAARGLSATSAREA